MNRTSNRNQEPGTGNPEPKVLLIRLRLIGDVVFTTPLIRALRRRFPAASLHYLVEPAAAPVVSGNPHLTSTIVAPKRRGAARVVADLRLAARLRRERYDIVIDLHGGPRAAWLARATGAPMRIGYALPGRAWMYTHAARRAPDLGPRHSVRNQWDLLAPLGIAGPDPVRDPVEMVEDRDAAVAVEARLRALGISSAHEIVVVHVSAGNPFRRLPAETFVESIVRIAAGGAGRRVLLTSGPSDREAAQRIARTARERLGGSERVPETGDYTLAELRALVARAAVYIGGDSGPLHVASTTTTPIVAMFGPTLAERSLPWRDPRLFAKAVDGGPLPCRPCSQRVCVTGDFRCLASIAPAQVASAADRALRAAVSAQDGA